MNVVVKFLRTPNIFLSAEVFWTICSVARFILRVGFDAALFLVCLALCFTLILFFAHIFSRFNKLKMYICFSATLIIMIGTYFEFTYHFNFTGSALQFFFRRKTAKRNKKTAKKKNSFWINIFISFSVCVGFKDLCVSSMFYVFSDSFSNGKNPST